jgi:hypothetical protein
MTRKPRKKEPDFYAPKILRIPVVMAEPGLDILEFETALRSHLNDLLHKMRDLGNVRSLDKITQVAMLIGVISGLIESVQNCFHPNDIHGSDIPSISNEMRKQSAILKGICEEHNLTRKLDEVHDNVV